MAARLFPWLMIAATVLLTSYGQLVLKWQSGQPAVSSGLFGHLPRVLQMLLRPWVISAFVAAFAASLCWMLAISRLELSRAYPFMALNFVVVSLAAVVLFDERMTVNKIAGLLLVITGLIVINRGKS